MTTKVQLDERLQRVLVTVQPAPQTETVADTVLRLTRARPELGGWDWIIDTRHPHVQATAAELDLIAAAFNARTSNQGYTIFVSSDVATYDRCALLATKFLRRRHLVAKDLNEAYLLLPQILPYI